MPGLVLTLLVPENGDPPWVYVCSADRHCCTRIPIKVHSVDTGYSLAVDSLLDSGATGMFIDVEYVRTQKLQTHPLPYAIPVYNIDGTPNEAGPMGRGRPHFHFWKSLIKYHIFNYQSGKHGDHLGTHLARWTQPRDRLANRWSENEWLPWLMWK